jgi:NTE family protein
MNIGLALSGGGVRASVFHLGVLERLARQDLLERITYLSTVSGGSLAVGLVFSAADQRWPRSVEFRGKILGLCRRTLTTLDLQRNFVTRSLLPPWMLLRGRASLLAASLQSLWRITAGLSDLPEQPHWLINATTYETGRNWRFSRERMGDYETDYVLNPKLGLAEAVAASAAVPGAIGPLVLHSKNFHWHRYVERDQGELAATSPRFARLRLWDGGVYDNLGLEALYKRDRHDQPTSNVSYREGVDFLLVSDASRPLGFDTTTFQPSPPFYKPVMRLVDIATEQVRGLRARDVVEFYKSHPGTGAYFRMGNSAGVVYRKAGIAPPETWQAADALSQRAADLAAQLETTLRRLTSAEFDLLYQHGYEVADSTLSAYCGSEFQHIPFRP